MLGETTAFKREYTPFVRRCTELEGILREYHRAMEQYGVEPVPREENEFEHWRENFLAQRGEKSLLEAMEDELQDQYARFKDSMNTRDELAPRVYSLIEHREVVQKAKEFYDFEETDAHAHANVDDLDTVSKSYGLRNQGHQRQDFRTLSAGSEEAVNEPLVGSPGPRDIYGTTTATPSGFEEYRFEHLAGIIKQTEKLRFERMVTRVSKRQAYVRFADVEMNLLDEHQNKCKKSVFVIFYRLPSLQARLKRLCDSFGKQYSIPEFSLSAESQRTVQQQIQGLDSEINHQLSALSQWKQTIVSQLERFSMSYEYYRMAVLREKAAYSALNKFERSGHEMLHMKGWVLAEESHKVEQALRESHQPVGGGNPLPYYNDLIEQPWPAEPTFFKTNKLTSVFQGIVDTYGVPRYQEANPALFALITFPFLYGVMFGDAGHGLCIFIASTLMILMEKKMQKSSLGEIVEMCFNGRYMLLLMGLFSIYCGLIYNDAFGLPLNLFGPSRYVNPAMVNATEPLPRTSEKDDVYPFGIDPVWHVAENELLFLNSLKMKLSIVLGVSQMVFGLFLKMSNEMFFRDYLSFFTETIPQIIFMLSLFGYMVLLIIYKWAIDWSGTSADSDTPPTVPPNLIDQMISIVLSPGSVTEALYSGQDTVQLGLIAIAFVCVPWMLLVKPFIEWRHHKKSQQPRSEIEHGQEHDSSGHGHVPLNDEYDASSEVSLQDRSAKAGGAEAEAFSCGDIMVHQGIETIEFVLGAVSNTASYLRLWALSLAHSQLAAVFWDKALKVTIEMKNPVAIFVGYGVWAHVTIGVLLIMSSLECFLHALRLHWVEFQNKVCRCTVQLLSVSIHSFVPSPLFAVFPCRRISVPPIFFLQG